MDWSSKELKDLHEVKSIENRIVIVRIGQNKFILELESKPVIVFNGGPAWCPSASPCSNHWPRKQIDTIPGRRVILEGMHIGLGEDYALTAGSSTWTTLMLHTLPPGQLPKVHRDRLPS